MKTTLTQLMYYESSLEKKHEILTAIGLATGNEKLFRACEEIRNDLPDHPKEIQVTRESLLQGKTVPYIDSGDTGEEEFIDISRE